MEIKTLGENSPYSSSLLNGNTSDREIRVMFLEPGELGTPIRVRLAVRPLLPSHMGEGDPGYEALSYDWGEKSDTRKIFLDKQIVEVTANLVEALQYLRQPDKTRILWIDAVCINQHDTSERNSQVLFMGDIFRESTKVLVWLGSDGGTASCAQVFINSMKDKMHLSPCLPVILNNQSHCSNGLSALISILDQPWWERTWTLQEILLAREAEIIHGKIQIPWGNLHHALLNIENHYHGMGCCYDLPRCQSCRRQYFSLREKIHGLHEQQAREWSGLALSDLLPRYRYRRASEPRDKIYALLGLVYAEQAAEFQPDYLCSLEDLCIKTSMWNLRWSQSLRTVKYASEIESRLKIPSWVTDWTADSSATKIRPALQTRYDSYDAAGGVLWSGAFEGLRPHEYKNGPFGNCILVTEGISFDKVKRVGETSHFEYLQDRYATLRQWYSVLLEHFGNLGKPYVGGGTVKDAFWRTLTADVIISSAAGVGAVSKDFWYERAAPQHAEEFWRWWEAVQGRTMEDIHGGRMSAFLENVTTSTSRRSLFITEKGYIGNGPPDIKLGDEIFILSGGKMPFNLRPERLSVLGQLRSMIGGSTRFHTLVGHSYVHGIMDGEAARDFLQDCQHVRLK